jgi:hypothetical protein
MRQAFFVEPTDYGWSVRKGSTRIGLFTTQAQALNDVERRRAALRTIGRHSTITVTGRDNKPVYGRSSTPKWRRH